MARKEKKDDIFLKFVYIIINKRETERQRKHSKIYKYRKM